MKILYVGTPYSIHDIKWMSFFSTQPGFKVYITCEHQHAEIMTTEQENELKILKIGLLPSFSDYSFKTPHKNRDTRKYLQRQVDSLGIDIVHVLFGSPQPVWLNKLRGVKKVITTRGSDVLLAIPALKQSKIKFHFHFLYKQLKKSFLNADVVTCTSVHQKAKLIELGFRRKIELIKTGIDVGKIRNINSLEHLPGELRGEKIVFSPRYMTSVYNVEYQIEAIKKMSESFLKSVKFVFIKGKNTDDNYYNSLKNQLDQITSLNFVVLEQVSQLQMWSILKCSDVVYMVPKSDGTPNSALECMAVGTPLIMGNLDYDQQIFKDVCLIADLNDPNSLAKLIVQAITSYPAGLLERAQLNVKKYGDRAVEMGKLQVLYQDLLK